MWQSPATSSSIFDAYNAQVFPTYSFSWAPVKNFVAIDPAFFLLSGNLKESTELSVLPEKHYILTRDKLVKVRIAEPLNDSETLDSLQGNRTEDSYYLWLFNPRLKKIKLNESSGFTLTACGQTHTFLCETEEETQRWLEALKQICVLGALDTKYKLGEVLGSGNSARVRIGKDKKSNIEYAVKSIPTSKLSGYALVPAKSVTEHIEIPDKRDHDPPTAAPPARNPSPRSLRGRRLRSPSLRADEGRRPWRAD